MKKNTLFLSVAITTFILVILASLLLKVRLGGFVSPVVAAALPAVSTQAPTDTLQPTDTMAPTTAAFISPQEAVFIASSFLGNTQVYSVDTESRYGLDVYKVTFSSGSIVFVSPEGHILTVTSIQPDVLQPTPAQQYADNSPDSPKNPKDSGGDGEGSGGDD